MLPELEFPDNNEEYVIAVPLEIIVVVEVDDGVNISGFRPAATQLCSATAVANWFAAAEVLEWWVEPKSTAVGGVSDEPDTKELAWSKRQLWK